VREVGQHDVSLFGGAKQVLVWLAPCRGQSLSSRLAHALRLAAETRIELS
jgi:hypothetical protein